MGLESGTYISDLNKLNPTKDDPRKKGDDHIRLVKKTILNTFPNVKGQVSVTQGELNACDGANPNSTFQEQLDDIFNGIYVIPTDSFIGFGGNQQTQKWAVGEDSNREGNGPAFIIAAGSDINNSGGIAIYENGETTNIGWKPTTFADIGPEGQNLINITKYNELQGASDASLKTSISPLASSGIFDVEIVNFTWNNEVHKSGQNSTGYVAQQVDLHIPNAVEMRSIRKNKEALCVDNRVMLAHTIKALQELKIAFDVYVASHP